MDVITEDQWQWQEPGTAWRGNKKSRYPQWVPTLIFGGACLGLVNFFLHLNELAVLIVELVLQECKLLAGDNVQTEAVL